MEHLVLWALRPIGINSTAPVKYVWLILMLVAFVIQAALAWRLWKSQTFIFPALATYLTVMLVYPARWLPFWRLWMQIAITILSVMATVEALFSSGWMSRHEAERFYTRRFCCAIGAMVFCFGFMMQPKLQIDNALPGAWRNYVPLYTDLGCMATLIAGSGYAFSARTKRFAAFWWHSTILMIWFAGGWWAGWPRSLPTRPPWPWFWYASTLIAIRIVCLLVWHATLIRPYFQGNVRAGLP